MNIIHAGNTHETAWNDYVDKHPEATFYHDFKWKHVMESCFGHQTYYLMCAENNSDICGILPLVHLKSLFFGSILCSMPFLNFGGLCCNHQDASSALLVESRALLNYCKADYMELRHKQDHATELPSRDHKVSMVLNLDQQPEQLWNRFKSKHRTNIRRAEKNKLTVKSGQTDLLPDFYRLISIGWRNLGTPIYSYSFFKKIVDIFSKEIEIFVIYHNGRPVATAFNGIHKSTVEGMWTYTLPEFARLQTNYFLYWKMIEKACIDGFSTYHLGRSTKDSGAIAFKKKWNATPLQLYWDYVLPDGKRIPQLSVDNPKYQTAIELWRKLPLVVSQKLGPFLSKYIP